MFALAYSALLVTGILVYGVYEYVYINTPITSIAAMIGISIIGFWVFLLFYKPNYIFLQHLALKKLYKVSYISSNVYKKRLVRMITDCLSLDNTNNRWKHIIDKQEEKWENIQSKLDIFFGIGKGYDTTYEMLNNDEYICFNDRTSHRDDQIDNLLSLPCEIYGMMENDGNIILRDDPIFDTRLQEIKDLRDEINNDLGNNPCNMTTISIEITSYGMPIALQSTFIEALPNAYKTQLSFIAKMVLGIIGFFLVVLNTHMNEERLNIMIKNNTNAPQPITITQPVSVTIDQPIDVNVVPKLTPTVPPN